MIYKFDHISLVASREEWDGILFNDIKYKFSELNLPNADNKKRLLQYVQSSHDMYFYEDEKMYWPTEVILYDHVGEDTEVKIENNFIFGKYTDLHSALESLVSIFGKAKVVVENDILICNLKGVLDSKDYILKLLPSDNCNVYLDSAGYGVMSFFSNIITVNKTGVVQTKYDDIVVNGNLLKVCFVKSNYVNVIFEFITMETKV